jgi:hypothetical protein
MKGPLFENCNNYYGDYQDLFETSVKLKPKKVARELSDKVKKTKNKNLEKALKKIEKVAHKTVHKLSGGNDNNKKK